MPAGFAWPGTTACRHVSPVRRGEQQGACWKGLQAVDGELFWELSITCSIFTLEHSFLRYFEVEIGRSHTRTILPNEFNSPRETVPPAMANSQHSDATNWPIQRESGADLQDTHPTEATYSRGGTTGREEKLRRCGVTMLAIRPMPPARHNSCQGRRASWRRPGGFFYCFPPRQLPVAYRPGLRDKVLLAWEGSSIKSTFLPVQTLRRGRRRETNLEMHALKLQAHLPV